MATDRLFVVVVDDTVTVQQRDEFTKYLRSRSLEFWHHIAQVWLVVDEEEALTATDIRDVLRKFTKDAGMLVVGLRTGEMTKDDWAGMAPAASHGWFQRFVKLREEKSAPALGERVAR